MANFDNQIGTFFFLSLQGSLEFQGERVDITQRRGVTGTEVTKLGKRGEPFVLISVRDEEDIDGAYNSFTLMRNLVGGPPVNVKKDGFGDNGADKVSVLNVKIVRIAAVTQSVGGFLANPQAMAVFEWTLIAV